MVIDGANKKKRSTVTGIRYPMFDLEDAVKVIVGVNKLGGGKIDKNVLAQGLGYTPSTAGHHINSAKYYNLVLQEKNIIANTELAKKICMPISDDEKEESLQKAFFACSIYYTLYDRFKGGIVPDAGILSNLLHREFGVSTTGKDVLAKNFLSSLKQTHLSVVDNEGNLLIPASESESEKEATTIESKNIEPLKGKSIDTPDLEGGFESYAREGLFLKVDPNNVEAIKRGKKFLELLLPEDEP
jgi:hypothetical protein